MSQRSKRTAMTTDELQRALSVLLRAASKSGITPLPSVARSANALLTTEAGFTSGRASYVLTCLTRGGVLERVPHQWRYQLLRGTLERDEADPMTLPERIQKAKDANGGPVTSEIDQDEVARLADEVEGLLEENERLTDEVEEKDRLAERVVDLERENQELNDRLASKSDEFRDLRDENGRLMQKQTEYTAEMLAAAKRIADLEDVKSENGKLEYDCKQLKKENNQLKQCVKHAESTLRTAKSEVGQYVTKVRGLQSQIETLELQQRTLQQEHADCIGGEAAELARLLAAQLQQSSSIATAMN